MRSITGVLRLNVILTTGSDHDDIRVTESYRQPNGVMVRRGLAN